MYLLLLFFIHFYAFSVVFFFNWLQKQTDGLKNSSNQLGVFLFFIIFDTHTINTMNTKSEFKWYMANVLDIFFICVCNVFILCEAFQFPSVWIELIFYIFIYFFRFCSCFSSMKFQHSPVKIILRNSIYKSTRLILFRIREEKEENKSVQFAFPPASIIIIKCYFFQRIVMLFVTISMLFHLFTFS